MQVHAERTGDQSARRNTHCAQIKEDLEAEDAVAHRVEADLRHVLSRFHGAESGRDFAVEGVYLLDIILNHHLDFVVLVH